MASSSWLPWIWAVETLASNQADTSVLIDLVKKIPEEIVETDDGKNAKELASLRILESLSVFGKGKCSDGNAVGFTPSDCCEDVLRQILLKSSRRNHELCESEMLRGDIELFVQNKKSSLPKCTLKQLKDVIVKDNHLIPLSLKERSGLLINCRSDDTTKRPEGSNNCDGLENRKIRDLSSEKRAMDDSVTANQEVSFACKQMVVYNANPHVNAATKREHDAFCTQQVVVGNSSASVHESRHVEDVSGGIVQDSGRAGSDLLEEPRVESFTDDFSSDNVDYECVALKKLKVSSTVDDANLLCNQMQVSRNVGKMTLGTSGEEQGLNIGADEPKKDGEDCVKMTTLGISWQAVTQETKSGAAIDKCEHSFSLIAPNSVGCGGVKATMEHDHQREILSCDDTYHDENGYIIVRNDTLLNSQYSPSQASLATVNGTKQQLCMICKIGGQLLVCSSRPCRRVIHERCLGVAPTFDARRSFYCPFCAYSRAVSEYSDSKKKYSLAKKALVAFLGRDEYRLRNSNILGRTDQNQLRDIKVSDKCIEQNSLENVVCTVNETRSRINIKDNPLVSSDLTRTERGRDVNCGGNKVDKRNAERSGKSVCCQSPREQEQQVSLLGVQNREAYNSTVGGSELSVVEKLQEVLHQSNGVTLVKNNEQKIASRAGQDSKVCNYNCKDLIISHGREQHTGTKREQDVSSQPHVLPCEPAKPPCFDVEGSSREKDDKSLSCYHSLRVREQEQQYPYPSIPQTRRKKVPWSNAEEEALKEGVRRFASDHSRTMPWKKILEFGAEIFEKHRTAVDLKDKWRNICKGSPKV